MAKTTEKTNAERREEPWRKGRPSFKAFYPELILLTAITIAFIALGARLSCAEAKKAPSSADVPPVVSSATAFLTSEAFAQDASLDAAATPVEPEAEAAATPVEPTKDASSPAEAKKSGSLKFYFIWGFCLLIPAALWGWRAFVWLTSVYGVFYEIRTDADNPKATTILVRRGIINKKTDSMHIAQVKDIQSTQSIWQKYFQGGVGTIRLFTKDLTDGVLVMKNMEEPSRVFNALDELRRRYWALGGIGGFNGQAGNGVEADELDGVDDVAM
ncbi:MAG: PH domain-containing protein [Thermoguttaceae bacterium]|nr:PH domain-containing protein [Thermoguttaceae bacterium]